MLVRHTAFCVPPQHTSFEKEIYCLYPYCFRRKEFCLFGMERLFLYLVGGEGVRRWQIFVSQQQSQIVTLLFRLDPRGDLFSNLRISEVLSPLRTEEERFLGSCTRHYYSLRSEKDSLYYIDIYQGFIEIFGLFWDCGKPYSLLVSHDVIISMTIIDRFR